MHNARESKHLIITDGSDKNVIQVSEAGEAKLLFKNRLQKLTLNWDRRRSNKDPDKEDQVLENLRPHSNIRELCIDGHGGPTCPTWLGTNLSVKGLEALRLDGVAWKTLPPLGELSLFDESGEECFGCITGGHFQHLKRLELVSLPNLKKWVAKEACPMLFCTIEVLIVKDCSELVELPFSHYTCYPLEGDGKVTLFPNLREFEVCNSPNLSVPPIPWTDTLCSVKIRNVGSSLDQLEYSKSSSRVRLQITGKDNLQSLDEVLIFKSLTELQELEVPKCPPMELKHLPMLTSLKTLIVNDSNNVLRSLGDVEWQLPIERLWITRCTANGKELTQLLSHLPKLSDLSISGCEKIERLGVVVEQQQMTVPVSSPSSSAVKLEDTQAADEQQQIAEELEEEKAVVEPVEKEEDGLLLFPAHLSKTLRELMIYFCEELSLVAAAGGGDLQALRSLQTLDICYCPKFLSDYKTSSCCPFPSSLQSLDLSEAEGMKTLEPLSNLTSLTRLEIRYCGEDLRGEGLWPLLTQGQLSELDVIGSPNFFAGSDLMRGLQDEEQRLLRPSSKLRELYTPDIAGLLVAPICTFLSPSLTVLEYSSNREVERFTKEQEDALQLLTLLQDLRFWYCDKLERLPAGLHGLANLKRLRVYRCPAIRSLPKGGLPNSLQELDVICCGNEELKQRCGKLMGTIPKIIL